MSINHRPFGRTLRDAASLRVLALALAASATTAGAALAQTPAPSQPANTPPPASTEPTTAQQPQPITSPPSQQQEAITAENPPPAVEADPVAGEDEGTTPGEEGDEVEAVVVTGYRASLQSAISLKRNSNVQVDAINAEDIADFPDANLAESLQRLPGVSIDRENGEGRTITVRGLGSDFTRVRLNGLEALSTAGPSDSGTSPNRGRGFDFNTFASELFSSLRVQKTASAETDEGSLGATVDLITGKPFDFKGRRIALSLQDSYYENGGNHSPRIAGLFSQRIDTGIGEFGALVSVAYNSREQIVDSYLRQAGQSDFQYRGATNAQNTAIRGFATRATPGLTPTQIATINETARGKLNDLTIFPALANLNHQELEQERLGLTGAFQWRPREGTTVTLDLVGSRLDQTSTLNVLVPVGLNRNNTTTILGLPNPTTAQRVAAYPGVCTERAATAFQDPIDCRGTLGNGSPVPNFPNSLNPRNLSAFDYYNNINSPGYIRPGDPNYDARGLSFRRALIGRPYTLVRDAEVNSANQATYLLLDDVDLAARADQGAFVTNFSQASLTLDHRFSDNFAGKFLYGKSKSESESQGLLAEFNRMDSDNFVYDERGGGSMPEFNYGFDTANPANWDFVKGFSALRNFRRTVNNEYETLRADFTYDHSDALTFKFGITDRTFDFSTSQAQRTTSDVNNPSFLEAKGTVAGTGKLIEWGQGLDVPGATPKSWWGPDLGKFSQLIGFDCDCINEFGDFRLSRLSNPGNQFNVSEKDTSIYFQTDFLYDVYGRELRGNVGIRAARTDLNSFGFSPAARPLTAQNEYIDLLPSLNLAYEVRKDMYLRFAFAKVMARPLLGNLSPGISGFSTSLPTSGTPSLTVGNPFLEPFRATNFDASYEWYFAPGGLFTVALFRKEIDTFPQNLTSLSPLQDILDEASITALLDQLGTTGAGLDYRNYILSGGDFTVRQFRDAPGGVINGVEVSYQQNLTFLPKLASRIGINAPWLENIGVQANYTHLDTELTYILNPDNPTGAGLATGPFTGASPDAFNATIYYDTDKFSARLSSAYRATYVTTFPLASGTCAPGQCDSPFVNDFGGSQSTFNLDSSFTYNFNKNITLNAEILNITDQNTERYVYTPELVGNYASVGRQYFVGFRFKY